MEDKTGKSKYAYDALGRLTEVTQGDGKSIKYQYGENNLVSAIIYPDGKKVEYQYNKNHKLIKVIDGEKTADYEYNDAGKVTLAKRSNGLYTEYGYDSTGNVVSLKNTKNTEDSPALTLSSFNYQYDNRNNIVKEVAIEGETRVSREFTYNELDQLTSFFEEEENSHIKHEYSYDKAGNRVKLIKTSKVEEEIGEETETIDYLYNKVNELTEETSTKYGTTTYIYDENGNMTSQRNEAKNEEISYEYTLENRLKAVKKSGRLLIALTYNGDGDRMFSKRKKDEYSENKDTIIPEEIDVDKDVNSGFDLTHYINDINKKNAEVLATYGKEAD